MRMPLAVLLTLACASDDSPASANYEETAGPSFSVVTGVKRWEGGIIASIRPQLPSPTGLLKTAALGLWLGVASTPQSTPPEVYLLRRVESVATNLAELPVQDLQGTLEPRLITLVYYQMPESGEDWTVNQYALWFDPAELDAAAPEYRGLTTSASIESWSVSSRFNTISGYEDVLAFATRTVAGAFRFPHNKVGFVEDGAGEVIVRFAGTPPNNGGPSDYATFVLSAWDPLLGATIPASTIELRNRIDDPAGGLWIVVADLATFTPIGAILCFTSSQPDDCDRAPNGHALLHPLTEVF